MTDAHPLIQLGREVRASRTQMEWSRAALARKSGLSIRFLAELESGKGNISYLNLVKLAKALEVTTSDLIARAETRSARPIALLGLRGAGKTTVGRRLAALLELPNHELDELVQEAADSNLSQIFEGQGEATFRRMEREALQDYMDATDRAVLCVGGGIVNEPSSFALLKASFYTVWLKATPRQHWDRVVAQGDKRPMSNRSNAMTELVDLWQSRQPLYETADLVIDTSRLTADETAHRIAEHLLEHGYPVPALLETATPGSITGDS